jgi:hypothetical protein
LFADAPAARTCEKKICGSLHRVEYAAQLMEYHPLLLPNFVLAALDFVKVSGVNFAVTVSTAGDLVYVVADVSQQATALVHTVKLNTNHAPVYRLL